MLARSAAFDQAVAWSPNVISRCDILRAGKVVVTGVPVLDGSVRADRGQFVRRTCQVTIADPALVARDLPSDVLSPFWSEIRLWRGLRLPSGVEELVPVGTFEVTTMTDARPFAGIVIDGSDRMQRVKDSRYPFPQTILAGSAVGTLSAALRDAVPWANFSPTAGMADANVPTTTADRNRDGLVSTIAEALAGEVYADPWGEFRLSAIPSPDFPPVWWLNSGQTLVTAQRSQSRSDFYNAVVATGQSTGEAPPPTSQLHTDNDPTSPTWWGLDDQPGTQLAGRSPRFFSSPFLVNPAQCDAAAAAILLDRSGVARSLSITAAVHPALEPGDVVGVTLDDGSMQQHLLQSFTMPLGPGTFQADTRVPARSDLS